MFRKQTNKIENFYAKKTVPHLDRVVQLTRQNFNFRNSKINLLEHTHTNWKFERSNSGFNNGRNARLRKKNPLSFFSAEKFFLNTHTLKTAGFRLFVRSEYAQMRLFRKSSFRIKTRALFESFKESPKLVIIITVIITSSVCVSF